MTHYTIYIRASNDTQESAHQRNAIEKWLSDHDLDFKNVDQFGDLGQSGAESGRELFIDLVDAIQSEDYEYVVS